MKAEAIVDALLGGDQSPDEFINSLNLEKPGVLNKFRLVDDGASGIRVYWLGREACNSGFIGYVQKMGRQWYAYRMPGFEMLKDSPYRDSPHEAANDLLAAVQSR